MSDWKRDAQAKVGHHDQVRQETSPEALRALLAWDTTYREAVELMQGEATAGRDEFLREMAEVNVTVKARHYLENRDGPWVGVEISDQDGLLAIISLLAAVETDDIAWTWVVTCGGRRTMRPIEERVISGPQGPSQQYVTDTFGKYFNQCYDRAKR